VSDPADFDEVASLYAVARPTYPRQVVDWIVDSPGLAIVDVGAGTGLFTSLLAERSTTVTAVEPSVRMLDELRSALPGVAAVEGAGERMPLPDACADVVTFAQAWHWVDVPAASTEAARVLRAGGSLALVWNLRDERVDWVRDLGMAMRADGDHFRGEVEDPEVGAPFGEPDRLFVQWKRVCTVEQLIADVRSRSYFALIPAAEQAEVLAAVRAVLDPVAGGSAQGILELPYVTAAYRYARP
jgi:SAM-dependent methyltransferase